MPTPANSQHTMHTAQVPTLARPIFHVTYDLITPESAERGDTSDNGFVTAGEWKTSVKDKWGKNAAAIQAVSGLTLREALELCSPQEDCGSWFSEVDSRTDYATGEEERRSLHPPRHISAASYARLQKLFKL